MAPRRFRKQEQQPIDTSEDELDVPEQPRTIDPYAVLQVAKDVTADQIKSAYRRQALKHHPDKASEADKATAHTKFQEIALAYAVLSDERRRKRYDLTGSTDESLIVEGEDGDFDWTTFYREQYEDAITTDKIEAFAKEYKGSQEEADHVLAAYEEARGDMSELYNLVMLSDPAEDEERFRAMINKALAAKQVKTYALYTKETAKTRQRRLKHAAKSAGKEAQEAEELAEELGLKKRGQKGDSKMEDLAALIKQRQKSRGDTFFDRLEEKYAAKPTKRKRDVDEPSEEAFSKNRKQKTKG